GQGFASCSPRSALSGLPQATTGRGKAASRGGSYAGNLKKQENQGSALLALLPQKPPLYRGTALATSGSDEDEMSRNDTGVPARDRFRTCSRPCCPTRRPSPVRRRQDLRMP